MAERTDDFADRKCMTPKFQLRYCTLLEAKAGKNGDDSKKRFSVQGRIPKNVNLDKGVKLPDGSRSNSMNEAVEAAILEMWPKKRPKIKDDHKPIKDGDEKETEDFEGQWYFNANSKNRPQLLGPNAKEVPVSKIEEVFYDGCYCRAYLLACAYENEGSAGVKWHLIAIQKVEDGEPVEHRVDASNMFEAVEQDEEDDEEEERPAKSKKRSRDEDDDEDERPKKSKKRSRDDDDDEFS